MSSQADLGTAFALATSVYGNNQLQFSGNLGYAAQTGMPSAAFRTSFSRTGTPEVSLTMRQLYLPGRVAEAIAGPGSSLPSFRAVSVSFGDRTELSDNLSMEYGFSLDSVSFLDRLNYFSPTPASPTRWMKPPTWSSRTRPAMPVPIWGWRPAVWTRDCSAI